MRRTLPLLLAIGLSLLLAAPAQASLGGRLLSDFADDGVINACNYSEGELGQIKDLISNDIDAYEPDFRSAVDAMIERRARGACGKKQGGSSGGGGGGAAAATPGSGSGSSGPSSGAGAGAGAGGASAAPGAAGSSTPTPDQTPTPSPLIGTDSIAHAARSRDQGGTLPVPLLAIAVLLALLALGALIYAAARWIGWEPPWANRARHAAGEAGSRASSTWSEFTDFIRLGR
jgi:hypothetical protein